MSSRLIPSTTKSVVCVFGTVGPLQGYRLHSEERMPLSILFFWSISHRPVEGFCFPDSLLATPV